jgi:phosphoribosylanthranilate isomerase
LTRGMSDLFVKICGLRTAADVDTAVRAGADAIGFVFAVSPRAVEIERGVKSPDLIRAFIDAGRG